jgi:hypothetical protein
MIQLAPVALFTYKRKDHFQQTIQALQGNDLANQTDLYIFSDGAKNERDQLTIQQIRELAHEVDGFKSVTVTCSEKNRGLGNSIISGVTEVIQKHGKIIVLEDDLITSPDFLTFTNQLLDFYEENQQVWSVTGYNNPFKIPPNYNYDVYAIPRVCSWGWGTWQNRWEKADWNMDDYKEFEKNKQAKRQFNRGGVDLVRMLRKQMQGEIDSWAIRWNYAQFKHQAISIWAANTRIDNIGMDGQGTHKEKRKMKVTFKPAKGSIKLPQTSQGCGTIERRFRRYIFMHTGMMRIIRNRLGV